MDNHSKQVAAQSSSDGSCSCGTSAAMPGHKSGMLRIPQNVEWFYPRVEGWLCDYKYVYRSCGDVNNAQTDVLCMELIERGRGLGKIMVYGKSILRAGSNGAPRAPFRGNGASLRDSWICQLCRDQELMVDSEFVVVAVHPLGHVDKVLCRQAEFEENARVAMIGMPSVVHLHHDVVELAKPPSLMAYKTFPTRTGANERLCAYD